MSAARPVHAAVLAALLIALLVGCSGGGSDPKAEFVKAATKVCDDSADEIEVASSAQLTPQSTADQVTQFLAQKLVPLYRKRLDALRALEAPGNDKATITAVLDDQSKVVDAIQADPATYSAVSQDPFTAVDARWDAYGVTACGSRSALPSSS
jgi:hypothetical protein